MKIRTRYLLSGGLLTLFATMTFLGLRYEASPQNEIERGTIDIGVVVNDLQRSVDFYTEVLGMKETGALNLTSEFGSNSGLTGGTPFEITILRLKEERQATAYKLMSFGSREDHSRPDHIQDDIGIQYITIMVNALDPYLERIRKHDVQLLGATPIPMGDGRRFALIQDPDGTFIELIGP